MCVGTTMVITITTRTGPSLYCARGSRCTPTEKVGRYIGTIYIYLGKILYAYIMCININASRGGLLKKKKNETKRKTRARSTVFRRIIFYSFDAKDNNIIVRIISLQLVIFIQNYRFVYRSVSHANTS